MVSITVSYYTFYTLSGQNNGIDVPGLIKITREFMPEYTNNQYTSKYKTDHMFYNWILTFDTEESATYFKITYLE